jgi:serine/threonine-protein kinase PpkA
MTLKAIIIEANDDYRMLFAQHLNTRWTNIKITEYDPVESGVLSEEFSGAGNDLVILGDPGEGQSALDWLQRFMGHRSFPPVIMVGDGKDRDIVKAIKSGAFDYISRDNISHQLIVEICEAALENENSLTGSGSTTITGALDIPGLSGYQVKRRISGGDIASVYLTHDPKNGRDVALKVLRQVPDSGGGNVAFDRFLREFEFIGKIQHPNVVKIYDLGIADDHAYIAMEFCSRGSLKRRIRIGMYPDRAQEIMRQIAGALGAIHKEGVLHRDLKPTNVLFREDESLALIDFGLAKHAHLKNELTGAGEIFGTPYYMSPEQGHGEPLDVRSDIYSLGVIFYEMLTGNKPFEGSTAMEVILKHARDPIPRLPEWLVQYQPAIDKMLAKQPEHRFQSVREVLDWQPATA